jgi:hypothetical protein
MCCHADDPVPLIELVCRWCKKAFCICRSCYMNHVYCSDSCRDAGRRESNRRSDKKYRDNDDVREYRKEYERERRRKKKAEEEAKEKAEEKARTADVDPGATCTSAVYGGRVSDHTSPGVGASGKIATFPAILPDAVEAAGRSRDVDDAGKEVGQDEGGNSLAGFERRSCQPCLYPPRVPHCAICGRAGYIGKVFLTRRGKAMCRGRVARR